MASPTGQLAQAVRFTTGLYGARARGLVDVHVRRNEFARLRSVVDPYPVYERIRAAGPFVTTPSGHLATADHAICDEILRSRRFGVVPAVVCHLLVDAVRFAALA